MSLCLAGEGLVLLFAGFPLPGLPPILYIVGFTWTLTCIAVLFYQKHPSFTLVLGWVLFIINASDLWIHLPNERSAGWFLYQHSLELAFIGISHVGYVLILRKRRIRTVSEDTF